MSKGSSSSSNNNNNNNNSNRNYIAEIIGTAVGVFELVRISKNNSHGGRRETGEALDEKYRLLCNFHHSAVLQVRRYP